MMENVRNFRKELESSFFRNIEQKDIKPVEEKTHLTVLEMQEKFIKEREEKRKAIESSLSVQEESLSVQEESLSVQEESLSVQEESLSVQRNKKIKITNSKDGRFSISIKNKSYKSKKGESKNDFYQRLITIVPEYVNLIEEI